MTDAEIIKFVWEGKLPLCFVPAEDDVFSFEQINPFYILVPRISYLSLLSERLINYFKRFLNSISGDNNLWFTFNGELLKTHYPVGLLYDLCASNQSLPWSVTVHFSKFPSDKLIDLSKIEYLESHFIYTVKEADYLKSRGAMIQSFQRKEIETLWFGLKNDNFDQFWSVNRKLMDPEKIWIETNKTSGDTQCSGQSFYKSIPCRLYTPNCSAFVQKLIKATNEKGERLILSDVLSVIEPTSNDSEYWCFVQ